MYGGRDPVTGKQLILTGSATDEKAAIRLRNKLRREVESHKSAQTNVSVRHLLTAWLDQHPADPETVQDYRFVAESFIIPALGDIRLTVLAKPGPSRIDKFYAELRRCGRRCDKKPFIEHRRDCPSETDPTTGATSVASRTPASR